MSQQPFRTASGGLIDRDHSLYFTFDGKSYRGHPGDTLASALLANGERLIARSFKYHRPRGIYSAGVEEPNALITLRSGARAEPNTRATMAELYDGLEASSQNNWPSLDWDVNAFNSLIAPFIPAGFYYKTFMGPFLDKKGWWNRYEHFIRRAAGMGTATKEADPDKYDKRHAHCDILVVGGGPAGLSAALTAAEAGARVILADEMPSLGGRLRRERYEISGKPGMDWVSKIIEALGTHENLQILTRTTAFGYYDHNCLSLVERVSDHYAVPPAHMPRQRHWQVRAKQVILATGAIEQPLVFGNNDLPGVMLAGAARAYANEYGVLPGRQAVIVTTNDDAYRTALDLKAAGAEIEAIVDQRHQGGGPLMEEARAQNIPVLLGHAAVQAIGNKTGVKAVEVVGISRDAGQRLRLEADVVCVSGGWAPVVHLHSQSGGKPAWDEDRQCFRPGPSKQAERSIGAANGDFSLHDALNDGMIAARAALKDLGHSLTRKKAAPKTSDVEQLAGQPLADQQMAGRGKCFIDLQDDVSTDDVALAHREGFVSVEHLKRYTTLGMGTDQGKTSNMQGMAAMAGLRGQSIPATGTTTFRPPYTPVAIGVFGGREIGAHYTPLRRTPIDARHDEMGCAWIDAGVWRRPRYYPKPGESMAAATDREVNATRNSVGLCDVSTLGKIDIQGPDAAEFLNRVYSNGFAKLPVGKARYGLMLREDGLLEDDGTTSRLSENHFLLTTTTANAGKIMVKLEFYLQAVWPELRVHVTSVTDQWAGIAIAGPNARKVLQKITDRELTNEAFPFMAAGEAKIGGVEGRIFRISFSGELGYEINVPANYGIQAWDALLEAGKEFDITPYGTEALGTMRIEKGHITGAEMNGQTTATDLGLGGMQSSKKRYIGDVLKDRPALLEENREQMVGFVPADGKTMLRAGSQIITRNDMTPPVRSIGHITAVAFSPTLEKPVALGMIEGGMKREGETVYMAFPLRDEIVAMTVISPHMVDPKGERLHD